MRHTVKLNSSWQKQFAVVRVLQPLFIFFREYNFKLKNVYSGFYTQRAKEIASARRPAAQAFYRELLFEARAAYSGKNYLSDYIKQ